MSKKYKVKKYPCIESTLDLPIKDYKIRLWVNEEKLKDIDPIIIKKLRKIKGSKPQIINWIAKNVPRINAIQVIDNKSGKGIVAYTVDFVNDPHG